MAKNIARQDFESAECFLLTVYGKIRIDKTFPNPELLVWIIKLFVNPKIPVHKIYSKQIKTWRQCPGTASKT